MRNTMKTFVLMAALTALVVVVGNLIGGQTGMAVAFMIALIMNFGAYWFSDKIVLAMYRAQEVGPEDAPKLYRMVEELASRANLPMPKLYIIPSGQPNAFATGRNPHNSAVAVTEGIMDLLTWDELKGVIGHELAHIKNRDILIGTIAATAAGAISMLANMAQWSIIFGGRGDEDDEGGGNMISSLIMIIVAPIAAMLIQMAISRSREYLADETGAKIAGNPLSLADALRKLQRGVEVRPMNANPATAHMFIVNPLSGGGVLSLFSTHPPIEKRVERLQAMAMGMSSLAF
jgi:heat shock protein HtpX